MRAMCSMIRPWAAAASCDISTRGTATPPLPSPPMTAWCSIMASEMNDCPTGVRTTVPPWRFATSSTARVVDTLVTTVPGTCARAMAAASVSVRSSESATPPAVTRPRRSPSASWAKPRSAPPALTTAFSCAMVSGFGSGR